MRTITCDICGTNIKYATDAIRITVNDGEHPHNGSTMTKDIDCCSNCLNKILAKHPLSINEEFDVIKRY